MKTESNKHQCCNQKYLSKKRHHCHGNSSAIYGLGVIGALFYFLSQATSFTLVLIGIVKSIFWPAVLMFKLLTILKM